MTFLNFLRMFASSLSTRSCSTSLLAALRTSWMKMFSPRMPAVAIACRDLRMRRKRARPSSHRATTGARRCAEARRKKERVFVSSM